MTRSEQPSWRRRIARPPAFECGAGGQDPRCPVNGRDPTIQPRQSQNAPRRLRPHRRQPIFWECHAYGLQFDWDQSPPEPTSAAHARASRHGRIGESRTARSGLSFVNERSDTVTLPFPRSWLERVCQSAPAIAARPGSARMVGRLRTVATVAKGCFRHPSSPARRPRASSRFPNPRHAKDETGEST